MADNNLKFDTRAIHVGNKPDKETGAVIAPIYATSTFQQEAVGVHKGYDYSRAGNPTQKRFETNIASLENGNHGILFSSGMAAITALFQTLKKDDHVIFGRNVYGGTYRLAVDVLTKHGFEFDFVDTRFLNKIEKKIKPNTRWVFLETPTNPLLELCDINKVSILCKKHNIKLAVDNTFMSPYGQSPLNLGADIIMHSATKYIGGHSDLIAGVLITNNDSIAEAVKLIVSAKNPLIYAGTGVIRSEAEDELKELTELTNIPVITSAAEKGVISDEHPNSLGSGLTGEGQIKDLMEKSDLIIILGSRFAIRYPAAENTKKIQVEIDKSEIGKFHKDVLPVIGDAKVSIKKIIEGTKQMGGTN